jgi:phosphatidylglycerol:prolipoprotein diacylglycerol transferase
MLTFPQIDPVAFSVGPIEIRWYALAYLAGFLGGWRLALHYADKTPATVQGAGTRADFDDFLTWAVLGVILGGRLGYILFYNLGYYFSNPLEALQVWHGGMSFHGGLIGMMLAFYYFCRHRNLDWRAFGDVIAAVVPVGLFFGRIANFINGELFGRVSESQFAMVFPHGGVNTRHPSQLYEAFSEGLLLFIIMFVAARSPALRSRPGLVGGIFLAGYAVFRFICEFFRSPDIQLGFIVGETTMGQLLCIPMFAAGVWLIYDAIKKQPFNAASAVAVAHEPAASDNPDSDK